MSHPATITESRRGFLGRTGLTLAAGLGLATLGGIGTASSAGAATPGGARAGSRSAGGAQLNATCTIYCTPYRCNNCATGRHLFKCVDQCGSAPDYQCYTRSCSGFCSRTGSC